MHRGEMEFEFSDSGEGGQFLATGKVVTFIRAHLAKNEVNEAVALYESCVENVGDALMVGFKSDSKQIQKGMANLFYRARDYKRAAVACEAIGEWAAAAKAHEASMQWQKAASCYTKAGDKAKAAAMTQKAGDPRRAAEMFFDANDAHAATGALEAANDYLGAAQLSIRAGDKKRAAQQLAQVPPTDKNYAQATGMLADILAELGRKDLAIQRLAAAMPRDRKIKDAVTADLAYKAGTLLESNGQATEAATAYEMVRVFNPQYKDVAQRIVALANDAATIPASSLQSRSSGAKAVAPAAPSKSVPTGPALPTIGDPFAGLDQSPFAISKGGSVAALRPEAEQIPSTGYVTRMQGYDLLKGLAIFEDLSLDEMKDFYNLCEKVTFEAGDVLIEQDQPGKALYIVREGKIQVVAVENGKEIPITTLPAGVFVGEMSLVDDAPTSARVKAAERVKAFRIRKEAFQNYLYTHDLVAMRVYRSFTRTLAERLRETNARVGR
jgi:tetratricopeptide (TPR) repeat protein